MADQGLGYRLTVVKLVPNANYEKQAQEEYEKRRYGRPFDDGTSTVMRFFEERTLEVVLTEAEFIAVKRGVLDGFR